MKTAGVIAKIFLFVSLLIEAGCEQPQAPDKQSSRVGNGLNIYARYAPVKIDIMPLTEVVYVNSPEEKSKIKIYVGLLDSFGCQIKSPGVFRFELYERVVRSAEPKGRRIAIWPDIDLTDVAENNNYWRDFLRAYEFNFDFEPQSSQGYVLQATCLCPNGKRLSAEFALKRTE